MKASSWRRRGSARRNAAGGTPAKPWLWQCEQIHLEQAKDACYVRLLLLDINRSGDPATELPRIDARAKAQPTSLYARCHMLCTSSGGSGRVSTT